MTFPLPFPWTPGSEPLESKDFQERVQSNLEALAKQTGQTAQYVAWVAPTLQNSWVAFNTATHSVPGYLKDANGFVHLRGLLKSGSSASAVMFTLPVGFRPAKAAVFGSAANGAWCQIEVYVDGTVQATVGGSTSWTSIDGITFRAEA